MIHVQTDQSQLAVGEQVRALVSWQHEGAPVDLKVQLRWYTEGRGDTNAGIVDEIVYAATQGPIPPQVEATFTIPTTGPVTYDGHLIRVRWHVRAVLGLKWKRDPKGEAPLIVVPHVFEDL